MDITSSLPTKAQLLTTKLYIPPRRSDVVSRQSLVKRLNEGMQQQLTLICAPAGFGKTTLLSEWLTTTSMARAWLSLDKDDNDPIRFWYYIVAALDTIHPGLSEAVFDLAAQSAALTPFVTALINTIITHPYDFMLVLDDYHLIHNQAIHDTMVFLLDHLPSNMHLVIATRMDPPLPLARLRARKQLIELRTADLRFTSSEAALFLRHNLGVSLSSDDVEVLEARTEGWIAGLQLTALSLRGRQNFSEFITSFTGSHRYIMDYLVEEVLSRLSDHVQTFLLRTCILDRLTAPLCNALTGWSDAQEILEQLEQANVFIIPLDDKRQWYRYHHLFADVLLHRLQREQPALLAELHRHASTWYEHNGLETSAVEHALLANDSEQAISLVKQIAPDMMRRGEMNTLLRWLELLPYEQVRSHTKLSLYYIWTLLSTGRWEDAERCLQDVERGLTDVEGLEATAENILSDIISVRAALESNRGNAALAVELSQQALERVPSDDLARRSYIMLHLAMAYWLNGNLAMANQVLLETSEISRRAGHIYIAHFSMYTLAFLQTMQGHLHEAHTMYLQALRPTIQTANELGSTSVQTASKEWSAQGQSKQPSSATGVVHLGLANLLYEWNDLDAAACHLSTSIELGQHIGDFRLLPFSYFALARLKLSQGDRDGACELMRKGEHALQQYRYGQSMSQQEAYRIELYIALGNIEEATRLAQGCHANVDDTPAQLYEAEHRAMARLFIARKQTDAAIALLHHQLQAAESEGRIWNVIKLLVLQALALQERGDAAQAVSVLARALSLAEPEGFIRTFVDEEEPMAVLLVEMLMAQQQKPASYRVSPVYVHALLAALGVHSQAELSHNDEQTPLHTLVEALSEREFEILRLIAAGLSNQEITEKLVIAMSTLKTHINHIYAKLDVRSRTQAIVRARALDLL